MTDKGTYIAVEVGETDLPKVLEVVRQQQRPVRILSHGEAVAEVAPLPRRGAVQATDPRLRVEFAPDYDPTAGVDTEDWPRNLR